MSFWKLLRLPLLNAYHLRHLHLYSLQNITHNFFEINRPISNMTWVYHSPPIIRLIFLLFAFEFAFYRRPLNYWHHLFILLLCLCNVRSEKICLCLNVTYITVEHSLFQAWFRSCVMLPVSIKGCIISMQTKFKYSDKFSRLFEKWYLTCAGPNLYKTMSVNSRLMTFADINL